MGLAKRHFGRFSELHTRVQSKIIEYITKRQNEAKADIETAFEKEKFVFTQDKNFKGLLHQARVEKSMAAKEAEAGLAVSKQPCKDRVLSNYNYACD